VDDGTIVGPVGETECGVNILQTQIRGAWKTIAIGTLSGLLAGTCGGVIYGFVLEERELKRERRRIAEDLVDYRSDDEEPPSKIAGSIRSHCRGVGLAAGIPVGGAVGVLIGIAAWGVNRSAEEPN
jgi:hypothetical protein